MDDGIRLGRVTSPVGLKGEVKVYPYMDAEILLTVKEVCIGGCVAEIENIRFQKGMAILKLSCAEDRTAAEELRDLELSVPSGASFELPEDVYMESELVGMKVESVDGEVLGHIASVEENPAHDIYSVEDLNGKVFQIPAVEEFIKNVDRQKKTVQVVLIEGLREL